MDFLPLLDFLGLRGEIPEDNLDAIIAVGYRVLSNGFNPILPFGNGAERVLENRTIGAALKGIDLIRHDRSHILRAVQEGIAFSFRYGTRQFIHHDSHSIMNQEKKVAQAQDNAGQYLAPDVMAVKAVTRRVMCSSDESLYGGFTNGEQEGS